MCREVQSSEEILRSYLEKRQTTTAPTGFSETVSPRIDRPEVVAHATLSALLHHWPSRATEEHRELLPACREIKERERNRWMTQRRIALAKLSKARADHE